MPNVSRIGRPHFQHRITIGRTDDLFAGKIYEHVSLDLLERNGATLQQDVRYRLWGLGHSLLIRGICSYTISVLIADHATQPVILVHTSLDEKFSWLPKWARFKEDKDIRRVGDFISSSLHKRSVPHEIEARIF